MVSSVEDWIWSSHYHLLREHCGLAWLEHDWLLSRFGTTRVEAVAAYRAFITAGIDRASPLAATRHQVLLGDDAFVAHHHQLQRSERLVEIARAERRAVALSLPEYEARYANRDEAMARAYRSTAFTMAQIAAAFRVSPKTVSRAVAAFEKAQPGDKAEVVSE